MAVNNVRIPHLKKMVIFVCLSLFACKNTLTVEGDFPHPLIEKLPLTIGVLYSKDFSNYLYSEKNKIRSKWEIGLGTAQVKLFNTVLAAMFDKVVLVDKITPSENIDLFFQPQLQEFQYNTPKETKIKIFEVWLKYNMTVFDAQGQLIADWMLTAYGKTPTASMTKDETILNDTLIVALRDIGAIFSLKFRHVPEINTWLKRQKTAML